MVARKGGFQLPLIFGNAAPLFVAGGVATDVAVGVSSLVAACGSARRVSTSDSASWRDPLCVLADWPVLGLPYQRLMRSCSGRAISVP